MAPPRKPDSERKTATGVSLTRKQRETFIAMGGSAWLQNLLDREAVLMERARSPRLPGRATARKQLAQDMGHDWLVKLAQSMGGADLVLDKPKKRRA